MAGCTTADAPCLSLISSDLHAQRFLYGAVQRSGRGADATLSVDLNVWDEGARRELPPETLTLTRAQATAGAVGGAQADDGERAAARCGCCGRGRRRRLRGRDARHPRGEQNTQCERCRAHGPESTGNPSAITRLHTPSPIAARRSRELQ